MVKKINKGHSPSNSAFTMIELIFAIVVIGITMLTIPLIMVQDARHQEDSLMQEGIMLSTTRIAQALTFKWGRNSFPNGTLISKSKVLNTAGDGELSVMRAAPDTDFRIGHFPETLRRRMTSPLLSAVQIGATVAPPRSINDFNGSTETLAPGIAAFSYKKQWTVTTTVSYVSDATNYAASPTVNYNFPIIAQTDTSNIKMVTVTATDNSPASLSTSGKQVVLRSYSSNIGEAEFYKRRY